MQNVTNVEPTANHTIIVKVEGVDADFGQAAAFDLVCRALEEYCHNHAETTRGIMLHIATEDGNHSAEL